jgi:hypothetical protein
MNLVCHKNICIVDLDESHCLWGQNCKNLSEIWPEDFEVVRCRLVRQDLKTNQTGSIFVVFNKIGSVLKTDQFLIKSDPKLNIIVKIFLVDFLVYRLVFIGFKNRSGF